MSFSHFSRIAVPAALLFSLAGCADPAKDKPVATVSPAAPTRAEVTPTGAGMETLTVDAASSTLGFTGSKVTGKHEGKFEKISGSVTLAGGKAEGGRISLDADAASVKTDDAKLDVHLKSADFFDAGKFPKATFASSEIKVGGASGATHTITGELNLHGVKKTISFPATITVGADAVSGTAELVINRKDFGIVYPGQTDNLIRDEVVIKLSLKAPRKKG